MDCRDTLNLISVHLDGTLSIDEQAALTEHVAGCKACALDVELHERLSRAIRDMGREEIQAPPELCGLVMGRLREERRTMLSWLPAAWRKAVAAAAAIVLIAGGSAGINTGLKIAAVGKTTGQNEPVATVVNNLDSTVHITNSNPSEGKIEKDNSAKQPVDVTDMVVAGKENTPDSARVDNTENSNREYSGTTAVADASSRFMLNSGMKITSTVLKLAVGDLAGTKAKAVAFAAGAGVVTQVFPEQSGGKNIVVIRITVTSDQAPGFIAELAGMGTLIDRQDESRDITSIYNETMIEYHDLQARISSASDAKEKLQLEAQASSYKQQLDAWDTEAGKRVIMLWLENR